MSDKDNVENHTIRLLQEMRAGMDEFRQEMTDFRHGTEQRLGVFEPAVIELIGAVKAIAKTQEQHSALLHSLDGRVGVLEPAVIELIGAVKAIAKTQEQHTALLLAHNEKFAEIQCGQNLMEKDMRVVRGRVERIEDRIGLVRA